MNDLLDKSTKNPFGRYWWHGQSLFHMKKMGFPLKPDFEAEVRKLAKEKPDKSYVD